ncbi:hypothetical protein RQP46_004266 [Phenoliferia psychrophenolica]
MPPTITLKPSSRPLVYPPEIVALIIEQLGDESPVVCPWPRRWDLFNRNALLLQAALIGRTWASAALSLLYSDLRLVWRASSGRKLLRALEDRPEILPRVRRLEVYVPSLISMTEAMEENEARLDWAELRKEWDAGEGAEQREMGLGPDGEDDRFKRFALDREW